MSLLDGVLGRGFPILNYNRNFLQKSLTIVMVHMGNLIIYFASSDYYTKLSMLE